MGRFLDNGCQDDCCFVTWLELDDMMSNGMSSIMSCCSSRSISGWRFVNLFVNLMVLGLLVLDLVSCCDLRVWCTHVNPVSGGIGWLIGVVVTDVGVISDDIGVEGETAGIDVGVEMFVKAESDDDDDDAGEMSLDCISIQYVTRLFTVCANS